MILSFHKEEVPKKASGGLGPLAVTEESEFDFKGAAVASLPGGRWLVVTRAQNGSPIVGDCRERLVGTILASTP